MKIIVRAFVVVLSLTGSAAYTQLNATQSKAVVVTTSSAPQPNCMPWDPSACGMR